MEMRKENIAVMVVISLIDLEAVLMTREQGEKEIQYQCTMGIARNLLKQGIIDEIQYSKIDTIFTQKYKPILGSLFADIDLK